MRKPPAIKAVDLFCGAGGLTHGLVRGGIKVVAGIDLDPDCRYPFEANNHAKFFEEDVGIECRPSSEAVWSWWLAPLSGLCAVPAILNLQPERA
jgi:predicted RNA methylase